LSNSSIFKILTIFAFLLSLPSISANRSSQKIRLLLLLTLILTETVVAGISLSPRISSSAATAPDSGSSGKSQRDFPAQFPDPVIGTLSLQRTVDARSLPPLAPSYASFPFPDLHWSGSTSSPETINPAALGGTLLGSMSPSRVSVLNGFDGINRGQGGSFPPDPQVAAGPDDVMEMANDAVQVFSKQGSPIQGFTFSQFFLGRSNSFLFDPQVLFDSSSGRWFASVGDASGSNVMIAVSLSTDPTGSWKVYGLSTDDQFPDNPIIGLSDDKFVITANIYHDITGALFLGARVWVISKAELVAGVVNLDFSSFGPVSNLESVHPVQSLSPTTTMYMVTTGGADLKGVGFHMFSASGTPPGTVTIQTIPISISPITPSVTAPQLGTVFTLDTGQVAAGAGDARIESAAWFQGKLWLTFGDGCIPAGDNETRACFRLTQINTSRSPIAVTQDFDVGEKGLYYFYPALRIDNTGNLAVVFGYSSATNSTCCYPSIGVTGQAYYDPANSVMKPRTLKLGNASDTKDSQFLENVRYGDYFGASVDPSSPTTIWVTGEYYSRTLSCGLCWSTYISSINAISFGFSVSTSPTYTSVAVGSSANSTITLTSLQDFPEPVTLSARVSPSGPTISLTQTYVALNGAGSTNVTLTLSTTAFTAAGTYAVTVTGTSGSISIPATIIVLGEGFTVSASPGRLSLSTESSVTCNITVSSINNFSSNISLDASISPRLADGPSLNLVSTSLSLSPGGETAVLLNVSTISSTPAGVYTVTVTGNSGLQSHSDFIALAVTPISIPVNGLNLFTGVSVNTTGTLTVGTSPTSLTLSGTVSVLATSSATGVIIFSQTYAVSQTSVDMVLPSLYRGFILLDLAVSPFQLSSNVNITLSGSSFTSSVRVFRNVDVDLDGTVDTSGDASVLMSAFLCSQDQSCFDPAADLNADGVVDSVDVSLLAVYEGAPDFLPEFTISPGPRTLSMTAKSTITSMLTLSSVNGFAGGVSLTLSVSPIDFTTSTESLTTTLSSTNLAVPGAGSAASNLTVTSPTFGDFSINITGTSGRLSRSVVVTVYAVDFRIFSKATHFSVMTGGAVLIPFTIVSLNSFAGTVVFAQDVTPVLADGPVLSPFSPANVTLSSGGVGRTSLRVSTTNAPQTDYVITMIASSGSVSHSINVTLGVFDFYITASPASVNVADGGFTSMTVQGTPINGYANSVSVRIYGLPLCLVSFNANKTILHVNQPSLPSFSVITIKAGPGCSTSTTLIVVRAFDSSYGVMRIAYFVLTVSEFRLSATSTTLGVKSDFSGSVNVTARSINNYPSTSIMLSVSGLPSCATYSFSPPSPLKLVQGLSNTTVLTLFVEAACPSEAFNITIQGSDVSIARSVTLTLIHGSLTVSVFPNPAHAARGSTTSAAVVVASFMGLSDVLTFHVSGMPGCVLASFEPANMTLPSGGASNLTLGISSKCSPGRFILNVTVSGANLSQTTALALIIGGARPRAPKFSHCGQDWLSSANEYQPTSDQAFDQSRAVVTSKPATMDPPPSQCIYRR